jgi:hypothetical protein
MITLPANEGEIRRRVDRLAQGQLHHELAERPNMILSDSSSLSLE